MATDRFRLAFWIPLAALALLFHPRAEAATIAHGGTVYHTYTARPADVHLYWLNPQGRPFRQFNKVQTALRTQGREIKFIMNGGLFEKDHSPCGLLVLNGQTLRPLNLREGAGNFYLKPNGVFYTDKTGAHIVSSTEYARLKPAARLAIQSGPLLLRNGAMHPAFKKDSPNRLHRNGVGIKSDGTILFAITDLAQDNRCNLYAFAEFFRSQGCRNALFLDGNLSRMFLDPPKRIPHGKEYGTFFVVAMPAKK